MQCKQVNYAYPSSDHAAKYNHGRGCWLVDTGPGSYVPWPVKITAVCDTEREAIAAANKIDLPWGKAWLQCQESFSTSTRLLCASEDMPSV